MLLLGLGPAEEDVAEVQDEAAEVERSAVGKWRVAAAVAAAGNASFVVVGQRVRGERQREREGERETERERERERERGIEREREG